MLLVSRIDAENMLTNGKAYEAQLFLVPKPTLEKPDNTTVVACVFGDDDKWLFCDVLSFVPFIVAQTKAMQMQQHNTKELVDDQKTEG